MNSYENSQTDYLFYSKRKSQGRLKTKGLAILGFGFLVSLILLISGNAIPAVLALVIALFGALIAFMTVTVAVLQDRVVISFCGLIQKTLLIEDIAYAQSSETDKYDSFSGMKYGYTILEKGSYGFNVDYPFIIVAKRNGDLGYIKASVDNPEKCVEVIEDLVAKYVESYKSGMNS